MPLLREGFEVHATSRAGNASMYPGIFWHHADLLNHQQIRALCETVRATHLLHLAWIATPGEFWNSEDNFDWVASGLDLVRQFYAAGGIFALGVGSCAEYSNAERTCNELLTPTGSSTVYGKCKVAMSEVFAAAGQSANKGAAWARVFQPYGPGEPRGRLIPSVIRSGIAGRKLDCTDGMQIRDFVFVEDVANALVRILAGNFPGPFNIGTGHGRSLREIISMICDKFGNHDFVRLGARTTLHEEPERVVADVSRMQTITGWQPVTDIEGGINSAIKYWREAETLHPEPHAD